VSHRIVVSRHGIGSTLGWTVVFVAGFGTLLGRGAFLSATGGDPFAQLFGLLLPTGASLCILGIGGWLRTREAGGMEVARVGAWCAIGTLLITDVGAVIVAYQFTRGVAVADPGLVLLNAATGGAIVGLLVGVYDADRRGTERELAAERRAADRLNQRLSVLNRVLRHDVRNDINVVQGYAEAIGNGFVDEGTAIDMIERKSREIERLSERARDIESLVARRNAETERIDVATIVSDRIETRADGSVGVDVDADLPDAAHAEASPLIDAAIKELIDNAIEHTDRAEVSLEVAVRIVSGSLPGTGTGRDAEDAPTGVVEVQVADDGPGIPQHEVDILRRGEESATKHGSGLGLWLVYWIVQASDGTVDFETNEPRGSVVTLRLPAADG
jgi:signal transduction histidine kinase